MELVILVTNTVFDPLKCLLRGNKMWYAPNDKTNLYCFIEYQSIVPNKQIGHNLISFHKQKRFTSIIWFDWINSIIFIQWVDHKNNRFAP